jgi:hypothetical protein
MIKGRRTTVDIFGIIFYVVNIAIFQLDKETVPFTGIVITLMDLQFTQDRQCLREILFSVCDGW